MTLIAKTIINAPIPSNCHIVYDKEIRHGVVIDPGSKNCNNINKYIREKCIKIDYVILTHEHFDHSFGADSFGVPILCTKECAEVVNDKKLNLTFFFNIRDFQINNSIQPIDKINFRLNWMDYCFVFVKNKSHSPGSMLFTIGTYVVTGDLLIKDLKTVTKLPWANKHELNDCENWLRSLKNKNYTVLPGHGVSFELDNYDLKKMY